MISPAESPDAPCERLAWDSEHFGLGIGRLTAPRPTAEELARALVWCRENAIDCLYLLADAADPATVRRAGEAGFGLVDVRVTLERALEPADRDRGGSAGIRPAKVPDDLAALGDIAAGAHRGTRFFNDPGFADADCERLYRAWIDNSARGWADALLVAEAPGGGPAGYVTCRLGGDAGSIGLLGVSSGHRGRGLGTALVAAALGWLAGHGATRAEVVTQGANITAQRLYLHAGFVTRALDLWYHLWPGGSGGRAGDAARRVPE